MQHPLPNAPIFLCPHPQCPLSFRTERHLSGHLKRVHSTQKKDECTFTCEICGFNTKEGKSLKLHMLRTHDDKAELEKAKKHRCYFCDKMFLTWGEILLHFSIHTGERPCICHVCGKDFTQPHTLKAHFKVHKENGTFFPKPDDFFGMKKEVEGAEEALEYFMP
ncbi:zinc finger protein 32-like [Folsomia candida]|uniref:zinc finger protein 32-like n=1 Tax=Folsomia candida TaxID=158441 RepID=UPI001604B6F7|nr:zinc finger protein 32-like [Folsomia candida]